MVAMLDCKTVLFLMLQKLLFALRIPIHYTAQDWYCQACSCTDDLQQGAISSHYDVGQHCEALAEAVASGQVSVGVDPILLVWIMMFWWLIILMMHSS